MGFESTKVVAAAGLVLTGLLVTVLAVGFHPASNHQTAAPPRIRNLQYLEEELPSLTADELEVQRTSRCTEVTKESPLGTSTLKLHNHPTFSDFLNNVVVYRYLPSPKDGVWSNWEVPE